MSQNRSNHRPQKLDTQGIRGLVFALAVSSTIGFWAIFSRLNGAQSMTEDIPAQSSNELPVVQGDEMLVVSLPPIPTLIPTLDASILSPLAAQNGIPAPDMISADIPTPQAITLPKFDKSAKGDEKPRKEKRSGGDKTTSTRSSY